MSDTTEPVIERQIRCLDCQKDEHTPWLPLLWRVGSCLECARTSVTKHLLEYPLHRCEVLPTDEPRKAAR